MDEVDDEFDSDKTEVDPETYKRDQDFGDDLTDGDLKDAVLEAEQSSPAKQLLYEEERYLAEQKEKGMGSFCDDDFDISTQELRDLVD